jgi:hypothetical protein
MKNKILTELFLSRELDDLLKKMNPENLRDDLRQELFVVLCECSEEKIVRMHEAKQLKFFATRIVLNMIQSKKSAFYYKYRRIIPVELPDSIKVLGYQDTDFSIEQFEADYTQRAAKMNKALSEMYWYQREILEQYVLEHGSAGKMVKDMNEKIGMSIPKESICATVRKAKEEVRSKVRNMKDLDNPETFQIDRLHQSKSA